jgi:glycerol kinase
METIGFLVHDIYKEIFKKYDIKPKIITASGGGARDPLLQFIADLLQIDIGHTSLKDRTALGVYRLISDPKKSVIDKKSVECDKIFTPKMDNAFRKTKLKNWKSALDRILR